MQFYLKDHLYLRFFHVLVLLWFCFAKKLQEARKIANTYGSLGKNWIMCVLKIFCQWKCKWKCECDCYEQRGPKAKYRNKEGKVSGKNKAGSSASYHIRGTVTRNPQLINNKEDFSWLEECLIIKPCILHPRPKFIRPKIKYPKFGPAKRSVSVQDKILAWRVSSNVLPIGEEWYIPSAWGLWASFYTYNNVMWRK